MSIFSGTDLTDWQIHEITPYTTDLTAYCINFRQHRNILPIVKNSILQRNCIDKRKHYVPLNSSTDEDAESKEKIAITTLLPVIQKKKGIDWIGNCRCISGANLSPANFLFRGGSRHEIDSDSMCLTIFLSFPNGKTRQVNVERENMMKS